MSQRLYFHSIKLPQTSLFWGEFRQLFLLTWYILHRFYDASGNLLFSVKFFKKEGNPFFGISFSSDGFKIVQYYRRKLNKKLPAG